jgi:hypothetical protein
MCFVGIVDFIFASGKRFLVFVLFFCFLNSIVILHAKQFFGLGARGLERPMCGIMEHARGWCK